jgi:hypothetical protein
MNCDDILCYQEQAMKLLVFISAGNLKYCSSAPMNYTVFPKDQLFLLARELINFRLTTPLAHLPISTAISRLMAIAAIQLHC